MTDGLGNAEDKMKRLIEQVGDVPRPSEDEWEDFMGRARGAFIRQRVLTAAAVVVLVAVVATGAVLLTGDDGNVIQPAGNNGTDGSAVASATPVAAPLHLEVWFVRDDRLFLTHREVPFTQAVGRAALEQLLAGPYDGIPESDDPLSTAVPGGTELRDIEIDLETGRADVMFEGDHPDDSDTQQDLAYAQIVYTLAQFPTVKTVDLSWESPEEGGIGTADHKPAKYEHLLPPIVVERPYAGERVASGFNLRGNANVFEATVSWTLTAADGYGLGEGFITATCGTGCRGTFEDRITYEVTEEIEAVLEVFESSAEDGSKLHVVRIPLTLEPSVPAP